MRRTQKMPRQREQWRSAVPAHRPGGAFPGGIIRGKFRDELGMGDGRITIRTGLIAVEDEVLGTGYWPGRRAVFAV